MAFRPVVPFKNKKTIRGRIWEWCSPRREQDTARASGAFMLILGQLKTSPNQMVDCYR